MMPLDPPLTQAEEAAILRMREHGVPPLLIVHDPVDNHQARLQALRQELCDPKLSEPYALPLGEQLTERDLLDIKLVPEIAAGMLDPYNGHAPRPWPIPTAVALNIVRVLRRRFEARITEAA
jgi:hypothetical protein